MGDRSLPLFLNSDSEKREGGIEWSKQKHLKRQLFRQLMPQ
jgi:hypothetical protein